MKMQWFRVSGVTELINPVGYISLTAELVSFLHHCLIGTMTSTFLKSSFFVTEW